MLIALLDQAHLRHAEARRWLERVARAGWASCPLTQNGCVRILSQPAYPGALPAAAVAERLAEATRHPSHAFWPDDVSLLDPAIVDRSRILGARQVTDVYLLALAVAHGGVLATFDASIPVAAVVGAEPRDLETIGG